MYSSPFFWPDLINLEMISVSKLLHNKRTVQLSIVMNFCHCFLCAARFLYVHEVTLCVVACLWHIYPTVMAIQWNTEHIYTTS